VDPFLTVPGFRLMDVAPKTIIGTGSFYFDKKIDSDYFSEE